MLPGAQTLFGILEMTQIRCRDDDQLDLVIPRDLFQGIDDLQPFEPGEIPSRGFGGGSRSFQDRVKGEKVRVGGDEGVMECLKRETCRGEKSVGNTTDR